MEAVISVEGLRKAYGDLTAVDGVSFEVERGEIFGMLGPAFPTARAAQGAGILLWFVMLIIGGAGPPPEVLSETMRTVGEATPLAHTITLVQDPWLGLGWNWGETLLVVAYLAGAAILTGLALRLRSAR